LTLPDNHDAKTLARGARRRDAQHRRDTRTSHPDRRAQITQIVALHWMHADAYAGYGERYRGAIREVACLAPVRRKFVDTPSPLASRRETRLRRELQRPHAQASC